MRQYDKGYSIDDRCDFILNDVQNAIDGLARIMDAHGDVFTTDEHGFVYTLGIIEDYLLDAEKLLENRPLEGER